MGTHDLSMLSLAKLSTMGVHLSSDSHMASISSSNPTMLRLALFGFTFISVALAFKDCIINNRPKEYAWEEQLQKDLSCNYDSESAPNNHTAVHIKFFLKYFILDSSTDLFKAYSWMFLGWDDQRLVWNETDYKGISQMIFTSHEFWTPGLRLLNEYYFDDFDHFHGQCTATSAGYVFCIPRVTHEAVCVTKITNWPFDSQNCTLKFGVWSPRDKITFHFSRHGAIMIFGSEYGTEWTIMDYYQAEHEDEETQLSITFYLEREAVSLAAILVIPTIILTILVILTHTLSVQNNLRLGLVTFSLLCHFTFINEVGERVPKHSDNAPTLLLYLRGSLLLNVLLIMFTLFLTALRKKKTAPPVWIASFNETILNSPGKYVIQPRWEPELEKMEISEDLKRKTTEHWNDFANILNTFCFVIVIIIYVFFIIFYMPRPALSEKSLSSDVVLDELGLP